MRIFVLVVSTQLRVNLDVEATDTIEGVLSKVADNGVDVTSSRLTFQGVVLQSDRSLNDYVIQKDNELLLEQLDQRAKACEWPRVIILILLVLIFTFVYYGRSSNARM